MAVTQIIVDIDTTASGPTVLQLLNTLVAYWGYTGADTTPAKAAFAKSRLSQWIRQEYIAARREAAARAAGNAEAAAAQTVNFS